MQHIQKKIKVEAESEPKKPEPKSIIQPPVKQYYTITMEVTLPATLTYKVLAEDPEQALEMIKNVGPNAPPKCQIPRARKHKATVYQFGTSSIQLTKHY